VPNAVHLWPHLKICLVLTAVTEVKLSCDLNVKSALTMTDTQKENPRTKNPNKLISDIWDCGNFLRVIKVASLCLCSAAVKWS